MADRLGIEIVRQGDTEASRLVPSFPRTLTMPIGGACREACTSCVPALAFVAWEQFLEGGGLNLGAGCPLGEPFRTLAAPSSS